ncbi:arf-GAP with dual PH domain-containing protein 1-like isoform X2 [Nelusetta ayraudi]|uniref:arf-GAP with dual PH domain-containing protein 1-like isoform X2 n=1 Tax=Nelusetta ayraudi TaxID=303726 RepID=UPI003F712A6C
MALVEPEGNNRLLQDVLTRPGNDTCADCGNPEPDWASLTLGVFVCQACSLLHRSIPHISRVKSVQETWDASEVELMAAVGNNAAKAKYEQKVPPFYYRPTHTDCKLLREQWIRAKYERNEFEFIEKQEPYSAGYREGFLWKRGRDNGQFLSRKFILAEREGALKYFNKQDARDPKAVMKIETLNATFQPAKIGNPCGLQITYLKDNSTRNIFVYHGDAKWPGCCKSHDRSGSNTGLCNTPGILCMLSVLLNTLRGEICFNNSFAFSFFCNRASEASPACSLTQHFGCFFFPKGDIFAHSNRRIISKHTDIRILLEFFFWVDSKQTC